MDAPVPPPSPAPTYDTATAAPAPAYAPPTWNAPPPVRPRPYNVLAIVSLGLALGFILIGVFGSIAAVICGHIAQRQLATRDEQGAAFAKWGLVLGYAGVAFGVFVVGFILLAWSGS